MEAVRKWDQSLAILWCLCVLRMSTSSVDLFFQGSKFSVAYLFITLTHIGVCAASTYVYVNAFTAIIKYMYKVETQNSYNTSLKHFKMMTSRRSFQNSFRESCGTFPTVNQAAMQRQTSVPGQHERKTTRVMPKIQLLVNNEHFPLTNSGSASPISCGETSQTTEMTTISNARRRSSMLFDEEEFEIEPVHGTVPYKIPVLQVNT